MVAKCLYCKGDLDQERAPRCPLCNSRHHLTCWIEYGGCAQFGCQAGPKEG